MTGSQNVVDKFKGHHAECYLRAGPHPGCNCGFSSSQNGQSVNSLLDSDGFAMTLSNLRDAVKADEALTVDPIEAKALLAAVSQREELLALVREARDELELTPLVPREWHERARKLVGDST